MVSKILSFLLLALILAGPSYAQNATFLQQDEGVVQLSNQYEVLSGLIASLNSHISLTQDFGDRKKLVEFRDSLVHKREEIGANVHALNQALTLKFLKGLMEI